VKYDGSLPAGGVELASPVINGRDFRMSEIKKACSVLAEAGARVTNSCGLHVHHEVKDFSDADIKRLVKSWAANQETINKFLDSRRWNGNYCRPWTRAEIRELENIDRVRNMYITRYKSLNINPYRRDGMGTVEIRQHHGTIDFEEIKSWVLFGQAFINSVAKRKRAMIMLNPDALLKRTKTSKVASENLLKKSLAYV